MQGAGKAKEAGTKARVRPFWIMLQSICVTLPLGGCLLTGDKPEPGLDIPPAYTFGPRNPVAAETAVAGFTLAMVFAAAGFLPSL